MVRGEKKQRLLKYSLWCLKCSLKIMYTALWSCFNLSSLEEKDGLEISPRGNLEGGGMQI